VCEEDGMLGVFFVYFVEDGMLGVFFFNLCVLVCEEDGMLRVFFPLICMC